MIPRTLSRAGQLAVLSLLFAPVTSLLIAADLAPGPIPHAPPPNPPVVVRPDNPVPARPRLQDSHKTLYSIGQPTDEEQLYLEFINRARANPTAEGERLRDTTDPDVLASYEFFNVDLDLMASEFAAIDPAPPLAMNALLTTAARLHTQDMFDNAFQGHNGSNGSTLSARVNAQDYDFNRIAENVYSYSDSVWYGHAGFNVDWGPGGAGGMQAGRGHRVNIHSPDYREIGIGVVLGSNTVNGNTVGPQLVTQDFGTRQGATPLITGVAYFDLNGNNFYDPGEGIGGIEVNVEASSFFTITSDSGGYAIPVPNNGPHTVIFTAPGLPDTQDTITLSSLENANVDLVPDYAPPVISGPNPATLNANNSYSFLPVPAAVAYHFEQTRLVDYTRVEGAEEGLDHVTVISSPDYSVVDNSISASGNASFHLAQPNPATDQFLTLDPTFRPSADSELSFRSRLGWASAGQVARVQVSTNDGESWQELWSRPGTGDSGQSGFELVTLPLDEFANLETRVRFVYDHTSGTFFPQTDPGVGWYLDDITLSNARELLDPVVTAVPSGTSFNFRPATLDDHSLRVRAELSGDRLMPWGPAFIVAVTDEAVAPVIRLTQTPVISGGQLSLGFTLESGNAATFEVHQANAIEGPWSPATGVTVNDLGGGNYEAVLPAPASPSVFYRVAAP